MVVDNNFLRFSSSENGTENRNRELTEKILKLKKEKNAIILAHYYQRPEVQEVADYVGDSLGLSQQAAETEADIILFAGVHFMAETAKILSPSKKVLLPDLNAGCSMADTCPANDFEAFIKAHPRHVVITYVNTTAEIKALTDIGCTSSNAVAIVESVDANTPIIFAPDRNLGAYIQKQTGRKNMVIWDGACHVHDQFSLERLLGLKKAYPNAKVIAHPECPADILAEAHYIGSTAQMLNFSKTDSSEQFIVATEDGILYQMQKESPNKLFIPAPPEDHSCLSSQCEYMKYTTLEKVYLNLLNETPEIHVEKHLAEKAVKPIEKMLEISLQKQLIG